MKDAADALPDSEADGEQPEQEWPLLAVQARLEIAGVNEPGTRRQQDKEPMTFDWRCIPGGPQNTARIRAAQNVMPADYAFRKSWQSEAMAVQYLVRGPDGRWLDEQPRINKSGLDWMESQGYTVWLTTIIIDIDNPKHESWTPEFLESFLDVIQKSNVLNTAGIYLTAHGWRYVQPLSKPVPVDIAESVIAVVMRMLGVSGVFVDWRCLDWTHLFRMPKTLRNSKRSDYEPMLDYMEPIDPQPLIDAIPPSDEENEDTEASNADGSGTGSVNRSKQAKKRKPRREAAYEFQSDIPPWLSAPILMIGQAISELDQRGEIQGFHDMYLTLGGALLFRGVAHEYLPEVIYRIAKTAGSSKPDHHRDQSHWTCARHARGDSVTGTPALRRNWPKIGAAFDRAMARGAAAKLYELQRIVEIEPLEDARKKLRAIMIGASQIDNVTIAQSGCGVGKTYAACQAAIALSETAPRDLGRNPPGTKTAISFDKNRLAIQTTNNLINAGSLVKRFRSPLSVEKPDGTPECRMHEAARAIQEGGHSVYWEFCEGRKKYPCPHRPAVNPGEYGGNCKAYGAYDGDDIARIATGNHALLNQLVDHAGTTGLLIIDEPPPILETVELTSADIAAALDSRYLFNSRYADAMRPVVQALLLWSVDAEIFDDNTANATGLLEALIKGCDRVDEHVIDIACAAVHVSKYELDSDEYAEADGSKCKKTPSELSLECVRKSLPEDHKGTAPPVRKDDMRNARDKPALAAIIGRASKVYKLLYEAVAIRASDAALRSVVRVEERRVRGSAAFQKVILVTSAREEIVKALRRPGGTVLSDANADLHIQVLKSMLSTADRPFRPIHKTVEARDRSVVNRYIAPLKYSSRAGWLVSGKPVWLPIVDALRRVMTFVTQERHGVFLGVKDPTKRTLCLITYRILAVAIRATLSPDSDRIVEEWTSMGGTIAELDEARNRLGNVVNGWRGHWLLGYYGGLRGMDNAMHADTYVTLGDPWPNLGEVRNEIAFLGLAGGMDDRARALCKADLEQAFGRSRAPERLTTCIMLHVGKELPGGSQWLSPEVELLPITSQPIGNIAAMTSEEYEEIRLQMDLSHDKVSELLSISKRSSLRYAAGERVIPQAVAIKVRDLLRDL